MRAAAEGGFAPSELAAYLDAFEVLTNTSTADGRAAYGPSYRSLDDFVRMHLLAAGRRVSSRGGAPCRNEEPHYTPHCRNEDITDVLVS